MKKVNETRQKMINGGATHYHWKCSVTPFITPTKFTSTDKAWYYAGIHAEKYGHQGKMSVHTCQCN